MIPDGTEVNDLKYSYGLQKLTDKDVVVAKHNSLTPLPSDPMEGENKFTLSPARMLDLPILEGSRREKGVGVFPNRNKIKEVN